MSDRLSIATHKMQSNIMPKRGIAREEPLGISTSLGKVQLPQYHSIAQDRTAHT